MKQKIIFIFIFSSFLFSIAHGMRYFVDSNTYIDGYDAGVISLVAVFYPFSVIFISCLIAFKIYKICIKGGWLDFLVLMNPYYLLLFFNLTKEQLIFFGFVTLSTMTYKYEYNNLLGKSKKIFMLVFSAAFLTARPIYFPVFFLYFIKSHYKLPPSGIKILAYAFTFILILALLLSNFNNLNGLLEVLENRAGIDHTGRDFFNDLCVIEKSDISQIFTCWGMVFLGVPYHPDTMSYNILIVFFHVLPVYIIIARSFIKDLRLGFLMFAFFYIYGLLIFWWSPTYGAYLRYFAPVIWGAYFVLCFKGFGKTPPFLNKIRIVI